MSIRLLVVDDHDLVRTGIVRLVGDCAGIFVCGEAACGLSALQACQTLCPDVVLLDVMMPNLNGVDTTKKLKQNSQAKVLALSAQAQAPYPSLLIKAGADGYITKGAPPSEMVEAIKTVASGKRYFSRDVALVLADDVTKKHPLPFDVLSERERQVAVMVVNCHSTAQIAERLFVSTKTVNTYRYRIFEKLGVDSDVKLTHLAVRHGLVAP